jgi:hypothetical protein
LENWEFELHGCPTLPKIAQQFTIKFSYVKATPDTLRKNTNVRRQLSEKHKYLHSTGSIFLSTRGTLVCERKLALPNDNHRNIYEQFSQFAREWGIEHGLPTVDIVLVKFAKKTGFTFNRAYIFSDKKLLKSFNHIRDKSAKSGIIKFDKSNKPFWNIDHIILSCCANEGKLEIDCDMTTLYKNILTRHPEIQLSHDAVQKALKTLHDRPCK